MTTKRKATDRQLDYLSDLIDELKYYKVKGFISKIPNGKIPSNISLDDASIAISWSKDTLRSIKSGDVNPTTNKGGCINMFKNLFIILFVVFVVLPIGCVFISSLVSDDDSVNQSDSIGVDVSDDMVDDNVIKIKPPYNPSSFDDYLPDVHKYMDSKNKGVEVDVESEVRATSLIDTFGVDRIYAQYLKWCVEYDKEAVDKSYLD